MSIFIKYILGICTIVGAIVLLGVVLVPVCCLLYYYVTSIKCPECGYNKFWIMVGGPYKCKRCGWQGTQEWLDKNPNTQIKGSWWNAD